MKKIFATLPLLVGFAALFTFAPQAEAHTYQQPTQCYETFSLGGLRYTYPVECPRNVKIVRPHGPVTYYQTPNGRVTIIQPHHKPQPAYYYGHGRPPHKGPPPHHGRPPGHHGHRH